MKETILQIICTCTTSTNRASLISLALINPRSSRTETRQWALLLPYSLGTGSQASTLIIRGKVTLRLASVWLRMTAPLLSSHMAAGSQRTSGPSPVPPSPPATNEGLYSACGSTLQIFQSTLIGEDAPVGTWSISCPSSPFGEMSEYRNL